MDTLSEVGAVDEKMRDAAVAYREFAGASLSRRGWSLLVLMPTAFMSGYGFFSTAGEQFPGRTQLFTVLYRIAPHWFWGVSWLVVGTGCLIGGVSASWQWLRMSTVLSWALSTGLMVTVLWAKFVSDIPITFVAVSWAYALWAGCGFSTMFTWFTGGRLQPKLETDLEDGY